MKRLLSIFLMILVVLAAAPALAASAPIPVDLFTHHLSVEVASIVIAAPSFTINEWLKLRRYSRAEWYRMKARGDTPDVIGEGRMQRVTPDADARWLTLPARSLTSSRCETSSSSQGACPGEFVAITRQVQESILNDIAIVGCLIREMAEGGRE